MATRQPISRLRSILVAGLIASLLFLSAPIALAVLRSEVVPPVDLSRFAPSSSQPQLESASDLLKVMSFNIAHGRANSFHQSLLSRGQIASNLAQVGTLIRQESPDVVALQEVDGPSVWSGNFDQVRSLAKFTALGSHYRGKHGTGLGAIKLDYGTALLSHLPLTQSRSQIFDKTWRDNKGFVSSTVRVPGWNNLLVTLVSVHLDFMSAEVRQQQVKNLIDAHRNHRGPLIVMGDLNCTMEEEECLPQLLQGLRLHTHAVPDAATGSPHEHRTFPADAPNRRIDWILLSNELQFYSYETLPEIASDHLAVVATLGLRGAPESALDDGEEN